MAHYNIVLLTYLIYAIYTAITLTNSAVNFRKYSFGASVVVCRNATSTFCVACSLSRIVLTFQGVIESTACTRTYTTSFIMHILSKGYWFLTAALVIVKSISKHLVS